MENFQKSAAKPPLYHVSLPYPPAEVTAPNRKYARILQNDYAGEAGELSAVTKYMYQSLLAPVHEGWAQAGEFCKIMRGVAIVEMHHLALLGQLIIKLGGTAHYAGYRQGETVPWNGGMISYLKDPKESLKKNIEGEQIAVANYRRAIHLIEDPKVTAVLLRIIQDEQLHEKIFEGILKKL